jgi:signal transduction histidine kinase
MWAHIRKYLSPPIFQGDEEKTRTASFLNTILLIVLLMVVVFASLTFFLTLNFGRVIIELFLVLLSLSMLLLMRRGHVRLASVIFSSALLVIVSIGTFLSGGFRGSTMSAYIGIIIITGLLLGNWAALMYALFTIAFTGWMVYADSLYMLPLAFEKTDLILLWGEFSSILIGIVGLLALVTTNLQRALERAKGKEKELSFKLVESQQLSIWAQEASDFKSHLLARVSHELRTPLGVIMGMSEMLQHDPSGSLTADQKKLVERIHVNSKFLETTFTELLEQSLSDKEILQMQATIFSPANILARVTPEFREQAQQKGLDFDEQVAPDLPKTLWGISTHIEQILFHLLNNAVKFTETGSISVKVFKSSEHEWAIRLRDTGIGISKDQQERIFEPFRQVDESITRTYGGVGLGLSIVKRLATAMKGTVQVESNPGQGSSFTVTLPLVEPNPNNGA